MKARLRDFVVLFLVLSLALTSCLSKEERKDNENDGDKEKSHPQGNLTGCFILFAVVLSTSLSDRLK